MSLNEEERAIMVQHEFEKAQNFFRQAKKNATIEEWDVVANRLYYAAFHAVSALLINDGRKVGSHNGSVLTFGQYYVKTGIFTAEEGRFYSQLQTIREKADYNAINKRVASSVVQDKETGDIIIKLVNALPIANTISIDLGDIAFGMKKGQYIAEANVSVISNTDLRAKNLKPEDKTIKVDKQFTYEMPVNSFTVIRIKKK